MLFKALTSKESGGSSSSSSSPPEAIQLHSNRVIDFLHGTTLDLSAVGSKSSGEDNANEETNNSNRCYSALSYQAIQTQQDDGLISNNKGATATSAQHARPDLGVWDCRIDNNKNNNGVDAPAMLLKRVVMNRDKKLIGGDSGEEKDEDGKAEDSKVETNDNQNSPPIVMSISLSDPTAVQTVIEQMRSVILNIHDEKSTAPVGKSCTTTIKSLQNSTFGKTLIQEEVGKSTSNEHRIALILVVIVPTTNTTTSTSAADEYKERQTRALLLYHLHKFCLEVNCTLCFVSDKGSSTTAAEEGEQKESEVGENDPLLGRNTTMSIDELAKVIRRVAMGLFPVEESDIIGQSTEEGKDSTADEDKEHDATPQRPPSIHIPGSHDAELIHGAYLRNASCEGLWDASKDDLNVPLPPRSTTNNTATKDKEIREEKKPNGDEAWLSELASSIGLSPESAAAALSPKRATESTTQRSLTPERKKKERPPVKKRVARGKGSGDKTPKDKEEVMSFFDNLIKSPTPSEKK